MPKDGDFTGSLKVKNPPYNAGNMGLIPGWGNNIPQATRQLSPYAAVQNPCSTTRKATTMRSTHTPMKSSPCLLQDKVLKQQGRSSTAIYK